MTRLRPVLTTATVASLGFLPMAISTSSGRRGAAAARHSGHWRADHRHGPDPAGGDPRGLSLVRRTARVDDAPARASAPRNNPSRRNNVDARFTKEAWSLHMPPCRRWRCPRGLRRRAQFPPALGPCPAPAIRRRCSTARMLRPARSAAAQNICAGQTIPGEGWWTLFHSRPLDALIKQALAGESPRSPPPRHRCASPRKTRWRRMEVSSPASACRPAARRTRLPPPASRRSRQITKRFIRSTPRSSRSPIRRTCSG